MSHKKDNPWMQASDQELLRFLTSPPQPASGAADRTRRPPEGDEAECPEPGLYLEVATGKIPKADANRLLTHAASCGICAELLTGFLSALEDNPSAQESAAIAGLEVSGRDWQSRAARELAATPVLRRGVFAYGSRFWTGWRLAGAGAAVAVAVAAGVILMERQTHTPERELALAYAESRTLELRVPEGMYAPMATGNHTRGAMADHEPAALLEARAQLTRELERAPQDAHLLELEARADVLEERYDAAAQILDPLLTQGPATPELLADAANAYYQRGLTSNSELDRSTALDYLLQADKLAPADPVILFNEAIVMEDRGQMMNAVEVWTRYLTVERDPKWLAEGRRKLAALEQTLNRLKGHQSRVDQILRTPAAMRALAGDEAKLASFDEEFSSYELNRLVSQAFPAVAESGGEDPLPAEKTSQGAQRSRGSPCGESCVAARSLLHAIGQSLELKHQDSWLADLLSVDIETLPPSTQSAYEQALRSLAEATKADVAGEGVSGAKLSGTAQDLFHRLRHESGAAMDTAARAGEMRAAVEHLFALQRQIDFQGCRDFAEQRGPWAASDEAHYPWIEAQRLITEEVCDDAPAMRKTGMALGASALQLAEAHHYYLMESRIRLMLSTDALKSGNEEEGERLALANLRQLYGNDSPAYRIANTMGEFVVAGQNSSLAHVFESRLRECVVWYELAGSTKYAAAVRANLAHAALRLGEEKEAEHQLHLAHLESDRSVAEGSGRAHFTETEVLLAQDMLEAGNRSEAAHYLDEAALELHNQSFSWYQRQYAVAKGMLELEGGDFDEAAKLLESEIRAIEVHKADAADRIAAAAYAQQDHDLYAELAATWIAQGRSPESVLALWERYRMRSRGLAVSDCRGNALECEEPGLVNTLHGMGSSVLAGQIVLMDRVLVYRADRNGVTWSRMTLPRQQIVYNAQALEIAAGTPTTTLQTASRLGASLSEALLPQLPARLEADGVLLLEPDPAVANLPWPVLPVAQGPLGALYPLSESRSILAGSQVRSFRQGERSLVVGASVTAVGEAPLPEALQEAETVHDFLSGSNLLLGDQATASRVAEGLSTAAIFHFAGHAVQTPGGAELLLASSSAADHRPWVDGAFLREHRPRYCRLAVLSACSTGEQRSSWHHPLQDMVETLAGEGVPEVVATRWQVDSQASVSFMGAFYGALATGKSTPLALKAARIAMLSKPSYQNPYYWGAYYSTGGLITHAQGELHASIQGQ